MEDRVSIKDPGLLRRLRELRILVIHPEDRERHALVAQLRRIGCQVSTAWPAPKALPHELDLVLFLLDTITTDETLSWMASDETIARIAIIAYETPAILSWLERLHVHGVLSKPIRMFGILAAISTAVGVVRHERRLRQRIRSLDETLRARRKVEQAVSILSRDKGISESEAHRRIREKSMKTKNSISAVANAIVDSSDI